MRDAGGGTPAVVLYFQDLTSPAPGSGATEGFQLAEPSILPPILSGAFATSARSGSSFEWQAVGPAIFDLHAG